MLRWFPILLRFGQEFCWFLFRSFILLWMICFWILFSASHDFPQVVLSIPIASRFYLIDFFIYFHRLLSIFAEFCFTHTCLIFKYSAESYSAFCFEFNVSVCRVLFSPMLFTFHHKFGITHHILLKTFAEFSTSFLLVGIEFLLDYFKCSTSCVMEKSCWCIFSHNEHHVSTLLFNISSIYHKFFLYRNLNILFLILFVDFRSAELFPDFNEFSQYLSLLTC